MTETSSTKTSGVVCVPMELLQRLYDLCSTRASPDYLTVATAVADLWFAAVPASTAGVREEWKLVPVEPTQTQLNAIKAVDRLTGYEKQIYEAALAASPPAPAADKEIVEALEWYAQGGGVASVEGVYDILGFMSGEQLYTHQLPRVAREARPVILKQHPQLAGADDSGVTGENWREWLDEQYRRFGKTLPLAPMSLDEHERIDPISELSEMVHPDKIIAVKV